MTVAIEQLTPCERLKLLETLQDVVARDRSYLETPIGRQIKRYRKQREWDGLHEDTLEAREGWLSLLALQNPEAELSEFAGRSGARRLEAFLIDNWGGHAPGTRRNRVSALRDFFSWAWQNELIEHDPMVFVKTPKQVGSRRDAHARSEIVQLITSQPLWRDRIAIALMARQGLRKNELRTTQLKHFNFAAQTLNVLGKGSKFVVIDLFPDLAEDIERYVQERAFDNSNGWRQEYLLYRIRPVKYGNYPDYRWEDRHFRTSMLSSSGMDFWWGRCVERAKLDHFPMHELRHTAGTDFHRAVRDYAATQKFMRHSNVQTTATYIHVGNEYVKDAMKRVPDFWGGE